MVDGLSKKKQIKSIKSGKGLQYLLNEMYRVLGNPVATFDLYYHLIAYTDGVITDDPLWNELTATGNFGAETLRLFKEEGWIDAVANSDRLTLMTSDELKYDRINAKLFDQNKTRIANLIIVACDKPFDPGDPELIEDLCIMLSREIEKSEFYQNLDHVYQETLIGDLLSGNPIDKQLITAKLTDIDQGLGMNLYMGAAKIPQNSPDQQGYFRDLFKQTQPRYQYYIYSDLIVMLIGTNHPKLSVNRDMRKLRDLFERENIYAGISRGFENPFELRRHYLEAVNALHHGLKCNGGQRIFLHREEADPLRDNSVT